MFGLDVGGVIISILAAVGLLLTVRVLRRREVPEKRVRLIIYAWLSVVIIIFVIYNFILVSSR
jgi:hypothetical protein